VRFGGAAFALVGLGVLAGCGGGGADALPVGDSSAVSMLVLVDNHVLTQDLNGSNGKIVATSNGAPWTRIGSDGKTLAVPAIGAPQTWDVTLYDLKAGTSHTEFTGISQSSIDLSPDLMALAYISDLGTAPQIKTSDRLTKTTSNWGPVIPDLSIQSGLAWDPLNRYMATVHKTSNEVILVSRSTVSTPIVVGAGYGPSFSPDGSTLAYITNDYNVALYNVTAHTTRFLNAVDAVESVAFSLDGKSLVVTALRPDGPSALKARVATMSLNSNAINYAPLAPADAQGVLGLVLK